MTPHIPEEFSTRLIDWSPFVIMGNTMPHAPGRLLHPQKHWVALPRLIAKATLRSIRPRADIT